MSMRCSRTGTVFSLRGTAAFRGDSLHFPLTPVLSPVIQFESTGDMPRFFAFDGSKYVVAYVPLTGSPFDRRLYFKRFSSADVGTAVPVAYQASDCGIALGATGLYSLASNGKGESLVVYSGQTSAPGGGCRSSFRAIQIGSNSQPKFAPIPLPASATNLTASYLDGKYYVAGLQIDEVTNAASAATLEVKLPNACNATGCLMQQGPLVVSRITPRGVPLDPPTIAPVLAAPAEGSPFVVSGAGEYLVVWREEGDSGFGHSSWARQCEWSITGLHASDDLGPEELEHGALGERSFIQRNGLPGAVHRLRFSAFDVVSPLGVVKDPNGIVIAEPGALGVLACGSDNCLVAWGAAVGGVLVTRLAADGSKLDSPPIQIVDKVGPTMLAARGSGYVLQYDNGTEGGGTVFLDATGHKSGPLKPRKAQREYPCGSNFLVFKQPPVTPGSPGSFVVSLVDVAGSVLVEQRLQRRLEDEFRVRRCVEGNGLRSRRVETN